MSRLNGAGEFAGAMTAVAVGCLSPGDARRSIDASVLIVIASSLGIARALEVSGAAEAIAHLVVRASYEFGPLGVLVAVYVVTMLLTEVITNNAEIRRAPPKDRLRVAMHMILDHDLARYDMSMRAFVSINFSQEGEAGLCEVTERLVGQDLTIVVEGRVLMAPRVQEPICAGRVRLDRTLGSSDHRRGDR